MGIDVVGGCPHLETDPAAANDGLLALAAEAGLPVDLHTDETLEPGDAGAWRTSPSGWWPRGFPHRVAASHCVSLVAAARASASARSPRRLPQPGIGVDCPPPHQPVPAGPRPPGRDATSRHRREGAARGGRQHRCRRRQPAGPFNPMGRGDPLETAGVDDHDGPRAAGRRPRMVTVAARTAIGPAPQRSDRVAVRAATVREAIAFGPADRHASSARVRSSETERSRDRG